MMSILTIVKWSLTVVLTCISLMASDAEHPFICLWALCMSSLEKCLFKSFAHFFNWVVRLPGVELCEFFNIFWRSNPCSRYHLQMSFVSFLINLDINPLSVVLVNMFSHSVCCLFILLVVYFGVQKLFSLMYCHLFII